MMASDRMMFSKLLGVVLLSCLSSAMLVPSSPTTSPQDQDEEHTMPGDPNTYPMPYEMPNANGAEMFPGQPMPNEPFQPMFPMNSTMRGWEGSSRMGHDDSSDSNMEICDMLLQASVPPPINQVPWFCVCSHCKSNAGPKGDRGDRGVPGLPGSPGRRGLTGFKGRPGFVGRQGLKGQKGDEGEKGSSGLTGVSGTKGDRGYKGDKGDQGMDGPQGDQGPRGENGMCPESCESIQGLPGLPGLPGVAGARGIPGVEGPKGPTGLKGDKGDMGMAGVPGLDGDKGDQGEQGECNCSDGADGADGMQGPTGPKGDQGDVGPQGPKGMTGEKGNLGQMGMVGQPGPCSPAIQSAFSALLTESFPKHNMPVPFQLVITNQQLHYNSEVGVYHAPVNGTYVFSFHMAVRSKVLKVGLFHNFAPVFKMTEPTNMATTSQEVVLHLNMGDMVWLQVKDDKSNGMFADDENSSSFSGYLLHPDSCDVPIGRNFFPTNVQGSYSWGDLSLG